MVRLLALAIGCLTVLLAAPVFVHAYVVWSTTEEFSFGYLVPVVSIALLIWRRAAIRRTAGQGAVAGLAIVVVALGLDVAAGRLGIHALAGLALPALVIGEVVFLFGWRAGREVAFPVGFLVFGLALFRGLLDSVGFALQGVTAVGAYTLAHAMGLPVIRDGLILSSQTFAFIVAEQCSGMSSLVSLLALAALWTYVAQGSIRARLAVIASALPLVVIANSTRVALVLLVAQLMGQDAALGFFHSASSLVLFGMALCGLIFVSRIVGCKAFAVAAPS
jgi:exosortase